MCVRACVTPLKRCICAIYNVQPKCCDKKGVPLITRQAEDQCQTDCTTILANPDPWPVALCFSLHWVMVMPVHTHTHTLDALPALFPGLPGEPVKPIWILLKQETVSGSGIRWATCKSAPRSRQITTPAPHHSVFLQAGCPSCHPTNSIKTLKDLVMRVYCKKSG